MRSRKVLPITQRQYATDHTQVARLDKLTKGTLQKRCQANVLVDVFKFAID